MLETLPRVRLTQDVHRFANLSHLGVFATKKGLTLDQITEVIMFDQDDLTKELMEAPFQPKAFFNYKFGPISRFSDGEWPVFYAAIGRTTAERESAYHYGRKAAGAADARRAVHYSVIRCTFSGDIVDLRPKLRDWPELVVDDYRFCNVLGGEAHRDGLDGFLSPSARDPGGTNIPAFKAEAVRGPVIEATATLTFNAGGAEVQYV